MNLMLCFGQNKDTEALEEGRLLAHISFFVPSSFLLLWARACGALAN